MKKDFFKGKKNSGIPILVTIFFMFTVLIVSIVGAVTLLQYRRSVAYAIDLSEVTISEKTEKVVMEMQSLHEPAFFIADQASSLPGIAEKPSLQSHPYEDFIMNSMDRYPQLRIIYVGYEDGTFFEIYSLAASDYEGPVFNLGAPEGAAYAILRQFYIGSSEKPVRLWKFLNSSRQTIGSRKEKDRGYDPRDRIWYKAAVNENEPVRTGPYMFSNITVPGITVSKGFSSSIGGVLGVDMLLSEMNEYLDELGKSKQALTLIFNSDGECVAFPMDALISYRMNTMPLLENSHNLVIQAFMEEYGIDNLDFNKNYSVFAEKEEFIIKINTVPWSQNEFLFVAVSKDQILLPFIRTFRITVLISLLILLASIPGIFYISKLISRPILSLMEEAKKIGEFHFDDDVQINTAITEIHLLSTEIGVMKKGLRHFSSYVPSDLVKQLLNSSNDVNLEGEQREMTFLFSDIQNFTNISENLNPEELFTQLSYYFEALLGEIKNRGGTIDKFIGDSIMAFWNAPEIKHNHADLACYAALEMQGVLSRMNEFWNKTLMPEFFTRIGIETGNAMVGNIGSRQRMNYTVIGDTVNLASRIEGMNKYFRTQILIGEGTKESLTHPFIIRPMDSVVVKGRSQPLIIYELMDLPGSRDTRTCDFAEMICEGFEEYLKGKLEKALVLFESAVFLKNDDYNTLRLIAICREQLMDTRKEWSPHRWMDSK